MKLTGISEQVFLDRYSLKDEKGNPIEKSPEAMWRRVAKGIAQIEEKLGLKELGDSIKYEIYYFRKSHSDVQNEAKEHNMDLMDTEFDYSDDDEF